MEYCFNKQIAVLYGVEEAIMIHNFVHWIEKNRANEKHYYKGNFWTYNSIKAFVEIFPFWTKRQIERVLKSLIDQEVIVSDEFNEKGYDRTKWYSIIDALVFESYGFKIESYFKPKSISPNGEMETRKSGNGVPQTVEPIPDSKTYSKQDISNDISNGDLSPTKSPVVKLSSKQKCQLFVGQYNKIRGTKSKVNSKICGMLSARLKEGYTSKDIFKALKNALADEYHVETNYKHITTEFILRPDKLDKFLNIKSGVPATEERKLVQ